MYTKTGYGAGGNVSTAMGIRGMDIPPAPDFWGDWEAMQSRLKPRPQVQAQALRQPAARPTERAAPVTTTPYDEFNRNLAGQAEQQKLLAVTGQSPGVKGWSQAYDQYSQLRSPADIRWGSPISLLFDESPYASSKHIQRYKGGAPGAGSDLGERV